MTKAAPARRQVSGVDRGESSKIRVTLLQRQIWVGRWKSRRTAARTVTARMSKGRDRDVNGPVR